MDPMKTFKSTGSVTIRYASSGDAAALERLAQLDAHVPLQGDVLVAVVRDEIWAAVSLTDASVIADPFRPSGELAFLLVERARQLRRGHSRRRRAFRPAFA